MKIRHLVSGILIATSVLFVTAKSAQANPVGGNASATFTISPSQIKYLELNLRGGELTRIRVAGDGSGDIDCIVVSPRHNVVASDKDGTDSCLLMVEPESTEVYKIVIQNNGERTTLVQLLAD